MSQLTACDRTRSCPRLDLLPALRSARVVGRFRVVEAAEDDGRVKVVIEMPVIHERLVAEHGHTGAYQRVKVSLILVVISQFSSQPGRASADPVVEELALHGRPA